MALVNVNRTNPDVFYRYKMPKLIAKVEGKGNGIKTVIENMTDIAKALYRPATYPTKYFGCELGAQTQFDTKHDRYIVNGSHEAEKLQDLLDGFIKKFVLCPECDNPETVFIVHSKAGTIGQKCQACGYSGKLDMRHRLTTFMLRNPPDGPTEGGPAKRPKTKTDGSQGDGNGSNEENGDQESHDNGKNDELYDDDEVDWGEDTSFAAQQARMREISSAAAALAIDSDMERTPQERADLFFAYVQAKMNESKDGSLQPHYKNIVLEAERLEIKDKAVLILAELLLTADILRNFKEHRNLFLLFTHANEKAQKYLLGAFEKLVGVEFYNALIDKTPTILKAMYDLDLIEEEVFIDWAKKVSKKYVSKDIGQQIHQKAEPFITWLKEAEEEESSEEEEEAEIEFTNSKKVGLQEDKPAAIINGNAAADEDDDIDLDDI